MKIGASLTSAHQTTDPRQAARWMIERAAAARAAELDSLFVGDHHVSPVPYYQNVPMIARLLAEWGDRPAGCLFLLPLWNPVLVAEQVATLASLHSGRFIMQCALGAGRGQFHGMGVNENHRPSLFEESLAIIRKLWAGEKADGVERYPIHGASMGLRPPEPVEVWIGGSVEASIDRAARLGEGWLAGPELRPADAEHWAAFYRQRCQVHGRQPGVIAIRRDIYVGESDAEAEEVARPILAAGYRGIDPSACVSGSIDTVVGHFSEYARMGYTDIIIRHMTDDQPLVLASYGRLKRVRAALGGS
jgi:alkanesulfonate monooxygenase SsuD/methylene tetrahydromethanopterin reductase-like flavin-dependent oxidoreductase (luciferase family)